MDSSTDSTSASKLVLRGTPLRYVLVATLRNCTEMTVAELVEDLTNQGFAVNGRASKTISDALRAEVARERVIRVDRGAYAFGSMARSTEYRIMKRVKELREQANPSQPNAWERWLESLP